MTGRRHYNPRSFDLQGKRRCTVGWHFVHIPSTTALAWPTPRSCLTRKPAPRARSWAAGAFHRRHGITVERLLTDNG
jgi:hypothetical protein